MLAVAAPRNTCDGRESCSEAVEKFCMDSIDRFSDFSDDDLLESIDFDDLFVGINDGNLLPDLEMDPSDILAEFSSSATCSTVLGEESTADANRSCTDQLLVKEEDKSYGSCVVSGSSPSRSSSSLINNNNNQGDQDIVSKGVELESAAAERAKKGAVGAGKGAKSSAQFKNPQGKKKAKVDWTPELHRRFVQAVEQLGVDKAVPSKILELMGIDCLTRHNIASHLQKYRSHKKHLLAREAEAASWSQRRQIYGTVPSGGSKRCHTAAAATATPSPQPQPLRPNPWLAPTIGFPPMPPPLHHFRPPLHVWGHPSADQSLLPYVWPKHPHPSSSPPAAWPPAASSHSPAPPRDPSFWHYPRIYPVPSTLTAGAACMPLPLPPMRFQSTLVPGIPPHLMYKMDPAIAAPASDGSTSNNGPLFPHSAPLIHFHPSKESIDAAIGDVLSKPLQPLPLGLKPPSTDGVLVELQRQGISRIPPAAAASCA